MTIDELVEVRAQAQADLTADDDFAEKWLKWITKGRKLIAGRPEEQAATPHPTHMVVTTAMTTAITVLVDQSRSLEDQDRGLHRRRKPSCDAKRIKS